MPAFIDDGYTQDATIIATPRYQEVNIKYRPMLRPERERLVTRSVNAGQKGDLQVLEATQQVAASLAKHVTEWDVTYMKNVDGEKVETPVPVTAENIQKLDPNLFEKIYNVVAGFRSTEEREAEKVAEAESAAAKNSKAGSA